MEIIWTKERTRFVKGFRDLNARFTRTAPEKNKLIVVVPLVLNLDLKLNKQVGFDSVQMISPGRVWCPADQRVPRFPIHKTQPSYGGKISDPQKISGCEITWILPHKVGQMLAQEECAWGKTWKGQHRIKLMVLYCWMFTGIIIMRTWCKYRTKQRAN